MTQQPQAQPQRNDEPFIQDIVIHDWRIRRDHGVATYGTGLQVGNGRNSVQDAIEEVMDLNAYLVQVKLTWDRVQHIINHVLSLHTNEQRIVEHTDHTYESMLFCRVCNVPTPCDTRIDAEHILTLLGDQRGERRSDQT